MVLGAFFCHGGGVYVTLMGLWRVGERVSGWNVVLFAERWMRLGFYWPIVHAMDEFVILTGAVGQTSGRTALSVVRGGFVRVLQTRFGEEAFVSEARTPRQGPSSRLGSHALT
jgi:hypothetical protein